jgi:hypothetical protein
MAWGTLSIRCSRRFPAPARHHVLLVSDICHGVMEGTALTMSDPDGPGASAGSGRLGLEQPGRRAVGVAGRTHPLATGEARWPPWPSA